MEVELHFVIGNICRRGLGYLSGTLIECLKYVDKHAGKFAGNSLESRYSVVWD